MWWIILLYIAVSALVIFCAVALSSILDQLDRRTRLSSVFLGGFVLAVVNSLPDLFTALSSVCFIKEPKLAFGEILGCDIIDLTILAFFIAICTKTFSESTVNKRFLITTIVSLIVSIILLCNAFLPESFVIPGINVNYICIAIVIFYTVMLFFNKDYHKTNTVDTISVNKYSVKQLVWFFFLCALALIIFAIVLTYITNVMADYYMIDKNLAGALFLGLSTALPEIISTAVFVKKKNFNLAVGGIIGGVAFDWLVLVLSDIFYFEGTVFMQDQSAQILTGFLTCALVLTAIIVAVKCFSKKKNAWRWLYFSLAVAIIAIAIAYLVTAFYVL